MKKVITALAATAIAVTGIAAAPAAQAVSQNPNATMAASHLTKKEKDRFYNVVRQVDPNVKYAGKANTIQVAVDTCNALRQGADMTDLMFIATDIIDDPEALLALYTVMVGAPMMLCTDQEYKLDI